MALDEGVCVQVCASAVLIPDTRFLFPFGYAIVWTSECVWTRLWKEQLLLVAEIDCGLSSTMDERQKCGSALSEDRPTDTAVSTHRHCCLYAPALRLFKTLLMKLYNVMIPGGPGQAGSLLLRSMVIDASLNWSSCRKTKQCRSIIADDARAFSPPGCAWRGCSG